MKTQGKLSEAEFSEMLQLLKRYASTELDQWALWKFDTPCSSIYIDISMEPSGPDKSYINLNQILSKE